MNQPFHSISLNHAGLESFSLIPIGNTGHATTQVSKIPKHIVKDEGHNMAIARVITEVMQAYPPKEPIPATQLSKGIPFTSDNQNYRYHSYGEYGPMDHIISISTLQKAPEEDIYITIHIVNQHL